MLNDILKIAVAALLLGLPLALVNATVFHGRGHPKEELALFIARIVYALVVGLLFSCAMTHIVLTLRDASCGPSWAYYMIGFFCCAPYFMTSRLKQSRDVDHIIDLFGIIASLAGYMLVIVYWEVFFCIPSKAGFLHEISSFVSGI